MTTPGKMKFLSILQLLTRVALGGVFIYASAHKIVDPAGFATAIANYQILPAYLVNPAALLLPWIEFVCGVCLVFGFLVRGGALIVAGMLLVFIGALSFSLYRGLDIYCGCFSTASNKTSNIYADILIDVVLLAMAVWVLIRPAKAKSIPITPYGGKDS